MQKRKVIKTLLVIITVLIIAAGCALFSLISGEKVKYIGYSQSKTWEASIEKSSKTSIGPNYFLNLYYRGNKVNEKNTVIKRLTLFVDGRKYGEDKDYHLSEYTGEKLEGGGTGEDHIQTFEYMPENEVIGHEITVEAVWKTGHESYSEKFNLKRTHWYD
ncbi:YdhH/YoaO family protein [Bacillus velezensis]|uniref:YdhH/YoaO family protein n=1 Tax=Bacillus velezensis TaxID=492670 RepID=UPI0021F0B033|nr:YdhH/YoaO family protein [Bacillus velezensis]MCV4329168.1 YdhH/YoaO family protein [Bacillus velezensis]